MGRKRLVALFGETTARNLMVAVGGLYSPQPLTIALHDIHQLIPSLQVPPFTSFSSVEILVFVDRTVLDIDLCIREYSELSPLGLPLVKEQPRPGDDVKI